MTIPLGWVTPRFLLCRYPFPFRILIQSTTNIYIGIPNFFTVLFTYCSKCLIAIHLFNPYKNSEDRYNYRLKNWEWEKHSNLAMSGIAIKCSAWIWTQALWLLMLAILWYSLYFSILLVSSFYVFPEINFNSYSYLISFSIACVTNNWPRLFLVLRDF